MGIYFWSIFKKRGSMRVKKLKIILPAILIAALGACSKENKDVIAEINDTEITEQQFQAYLDFKRIKVRDDAHKQTLLDQYLQREGLRLLIESKQAEKLKSATQAELADFRRQMVISRYFEQHLKDAVNDEKIQNYYLNNPQKYSQEKVHVAHVLIRLQRGMSEEDRKVRLTTINEAYSKLKSGADFAEIAKEYSEDKVSSKKGGDLGWMKKGAVDVKFSEAIFSTPEGEISLPFETAFGYHIIKVIAAPNTVVQSLESVTGDIRYTLRQQIRQVHEAELQKQLKISKK